MIWSILHGKHGAVRKDASRLALSMEYKDEAKAILLSFNEVSYRNQQANIFWLDEDDPTQEKKPVYEMHVGKNKFGSFKGRLFYNFKPHMSYFMEVPEAMTQKYNQMITG